MFVDTHWVSQPYQVRGKIEQDQVFHCSVKVQPCVQVWCSCYLFSGLVARVAVGSMKIAAAQCSASALPVTQCIRVPSQPCGFPFYRWGKWGTRRLGNISEATELASGGSGVRTYAPGTLLLATVCPTYGGHLSPVEPTVGFKRNLQKFSNQEFLK